jgi:glycerol kinase
MRHILALDQGTTSSRAILFDQQWQVVSRAQQPLELHYPQDGWVEVDAQALWDGQLAAARHVMSVAGADKVAAIGITNQRETTVLWDRATGVPLHRAIVWQDRRTSAHCEQLRAAGHEARISERTGLLLDPYFSATKLAWLLDHVPSARERAERGELCFGTIDSWLLFKLSGHRLHLTDPSNASRTMLFDLQRQCWDPKLLGLFNIPPFLMPRVVPSIGVCGETDPALFGRAIPIAGIAGDQQAATFGQGCTRPGMAKNTYGTGCFMLQHTGTAPLPSRHRLLTTIGWSSATDIQYLLEGSVFMGGAIVQWLRDGLGIVRDAGEVEALAASVASSDGVILVPAFTGLGAPYWDPDARASLLGMTRATGRAHIARAALEAIALQCADVLAAMRQDAGAGLSELRVDGGASANNLLMQYQADVLGVPVLRPRMTESTALGAARLAALGCGAWQDGDEGAVWQLERAFEPRWSQDRREATLAQWRRAVAHTRVWRAEAQA